MVKRFSVSRMRDFLVSVILSAHVKRFSVPRMWYFSSQEKRKVEVGRDNAAFESGEAEQKVYGTIEVSAGN